MSNAMQQADISEPLQRRQRETAEPRFQIWRGHRGGWIVGDRLGLVGGIFVSEAAARHYAFEESGGRHDQVALLPAAGTVGRDLRFVA